MGRASASAIAVIMLLTAGGCVTRGANPSGGTVPRDYQLPPAQHRAWMPIREAWFAGPYRDCLRRFNVRMSCAGCTHAYLRVVLSIDRDGRLADAVIVKEGLCSIEAAGELRRCFLEYFHGISFPPELRGARFEAMLGTGLSC